MGSERERARLSLCMIVRDEARLLPRCLESVPEVVDEIVVVDTGSADATPDIARRHGARVLFRPWTGHFGEARNFALDQATGDWLLVMDADEALHPDDRAAVRPLLSHPTAEGFVVKVVNFFGSEASDCFAVDPVCRLFRNRPEYRYEHRIHEEIGRVIAARSSPDRLLPADVRILHYGYLDDIRQAKQKDERNLAILRDLLEADGDDPAFLYCFGTEEMQAGHRRQALQHLLRAWQLRRGDEGFASDLIHKIALCHWELGDVPRALEALETGIRLYADFPDLHFLQGQVLQSAGQLDRAVAAYRRAIQIGPAPAHYTAMHGAGTFLARHGLGQAYEAAALPARAAREYFLALRENPGFQLALRDLLRVLGEWRQPEGIGDFIESHFRAESADSVLTLCELLVAARLADLADERLARLVPNQVRDQNRYWLALGQASLALGRGDEAVAALERIEAGSPYRGAAVLALLTCHWARGAWDRARPLLDELVALTPERARLYRAFHAQHAPGQGQSEGDLRAALSAGAHLVPLLDALLSLDAHALVSATLSLIERRPPARLAIAETLARHGWLTEAEHWLAATEAEQARDASLERIRAGWHAARGDWATAIRLQQGALDEAPTDMAQYLAMSQWWQRRAAQVLCAAAPDSGRRPEAVAAVLARLVPDPAADPPPFTGSHPSRSHAP